LNPPHAEALGDADGLPDADAEALGLNEALGESDGEMCRVDCPTTLAAGTYAASRFITAGEATSF